MAVARWGRGALRGAGLCALLAVNAGAAGASCRLALALGLDVSGSVDAREYRLQVDGLAAALGDPRVVEAFLALPDHRVQLAVFEWSGPADQRVILGWREIAEPADLRRIAGALRLVRRSVVEDSTALGAAKLFGAALLRQRDGCARLVLDLSGDGVSNVGPHPASVRPERVTINGLVIGVPERRDQRSPGLGELSAYYNAHVIEGPGAFVETALGFEAFATAMTRKLLREVEAVVFGQGGDVRHGGFEDPREARFSGAVSDE
ncbi:DUF1194 domain-containing protein [Cognatishimia sp. F0-27]|nr:DUF1194 domain-containing protein [Cognatishimia sp. F0-27]